MTLPSVIDNQQHRLADVLNALMVRCAGGPVDVATAYFAISGYRLVCERLCQAGALWLFDGRRGGWYETAGFRHAVGSAGMCRRVIMTATENSHDHSCSI